MKRSFFSNAGVSLIAVIFMMLAFSILGLVGVSLVATTSDESLNALRSSQALSLAEAAIKYVLESQLAGDNDWSDNEDILNKPLGEGTFNIEYQSKTQTSATIKFTGNVEGVTRKIIRSFSKSPWPEAFDYALFGENTDGEEVEIKNNVLISGDFYYNGDVIMKNSSEVTDGYVYSDSLTLEDDANATQGEMPEPRPEYPTFDTSYYDNLLALTQQGASDSLTLSGNDTLNLNGQTLYYTQVTIKNNASLIGPGTIVVTDGNFKVENSASIGQDITIITEGEVKLKDSSTYGSSLTVVAKDDVKVKNSVVIPAEGIIYSESNITFENNTQITGSILAPNDGSLVKFENSAELTGIIYSDELELKNNASITGSAVTDEIEELKNSANITYDENALPDSPPQGFSATQGSVELGAWVETY